MNAGRTEVTVELRQDNPDKGAIAVFDGRTDENGKEIWTWLPRKEIEFTQIKGSVIEVELPVWLAKEKELI